MVSSNQYYNCGENSLYQILNTVTAMIDTEHFYYPFQRPFQNSEIIPDASRILCKEQDPLSSTNSFESSKKLSFPSSPNTVTVEFSYMTSSTSTSPLNQKKSKEWSTRIRREVCQWMYKVIDHYYFDRNIVAIAMNCFTRFLSNSSKNEIPSFELITATSLYIAIKLHGPKLSASDNLLENFVRMSNNRFDETKIIEMEIFMLNKLHWKVNPNTPQHFIPYYVNILSYFEKNLDESEQIQLIELSFYIVELIVFNPQFMDNDRPSSLACAAMVIALKGINASDQESEITCVSNDKDTFRPPIDPFEYLSPLFFHGLVLKSSISSLVREIEAYLRKVSSPANNVQLYIDSNGILSKHPTSTYGNSTCNQTKNAHPT